MSWDKRWVFPGVTLSGFGETPEDGWESALEGLMQDHGDPPEPSFIERLEESTPDELRAGITAYEQVIKEFQSEIEAYKRLLAAIEDREKKQKLP